MRERSKDPDFESGARHFKSTVDTRARSSVPADYAECAWGADADTTVIVRGIAGDLRSAHPMRLRLQFSGRELLVDEHHWSITIDRAADNDVVVKGHLISRLHARIEITHNRLIRLLDQSTNGTFVQIADGEGLFIHRDGLQLRGRGLIGLGCLPERDAPHTISFTCEEI